MKAILKRDLIENYKSIIVYFIFIGVFLGVLYFVNLEHDLKYTLLGVLTGGSVVIFLNMIINDIFSLSYKTYFTYPISRIEFINAKYLEYIVCAIIYITIGSLTFIVNSKFLDSVNFPLMSKTFITSYISMIIPIQLFFSKFRKEYGLMVMGSLMIFFATSLSFFINDLKDIFEKPLYIFYLISFALFSLSYIFSRIIIRKKEF
ncbi:ABC-2 transporter permease [Peptoniphilus raoultii]|uniref:ABC-2 transporter permease n=1 Tax=Peptoniphilus raoultii TaxID=1776387 RepID=UPI0008DAF8BE|nr:ABC-2 transporter permease [Peptoniphilus raoultii]